MTIQFPENLTLTLFGANPLAERLANGFAERGVARFLLGEMDLFAPSFLRPGDFHVPGSRPDAVASLASRLHKANPRVQIEHYARRGHDDGFRWLQCAVQESHLIVDASPSAIAAGTLNWLAIQQTRPALYLDLEEAAARGTVYYFIPRCSELASAFGATPCRECGPSPRCPDDSAARFPMLHFLEIVLRVASALVDPDSPFRSLIWRQSNAIEVRAPNPAQLSLGQRADIRYREGASPNPKCSMCSPVLTPRPPEIAVLPARGALGNGFVRRVPTEPVAFEDSVLKAAM